MKQLLKNLGCVIGIHDVEKDHYVTERSGKRKENYFYLYCKNCKKFIKRNACND